MDKNILIELLLYSLIVISINIKKLRFIQYHIYIILLIDFITNNGIILNAHFIIYTFFGFFISPIFVNISMYLTYKSVLSGVLKDKISGYNLAYTSILASLEELLWRSVFFSDKNIRFIVLIILVLINSFLFTIAHNSIRGVVDFLERFIYTIFLCISYILFPGLNYGLHIGRNILIKFL